MTPKQRFCYLKQENSTFQLTHILHKTQLHATLNSLKIGINHAVQQLFLPLFYRFMLLVSKAYDTCTDCLRDKSRTLTLSVAYINTTKNGIFALQFIGKISFSPYCIHLPTLKPIYFKKEKSIRFQPLHYQKLHFNTFKKIE